MAQTRIMYDVIVVGAGMIGSAAARHLAESTGMKVLLIGPEEPEVFINASLILSLSILDLFSITL